MMRDAEPREMAGWYKLDPTTGELLYAPTLIESKGYRLDATTPIRGEDTDGWHWCASRKSAIATLGYKESVEERPCKDCPFKKTEVANGTTPVAVG
jgi:hypothetical protein